MFSMREIRETAAYRDDGREYGIWKLAKAFARVLAGSETDPIAIKVIRATVAAALVTGLGVTFVSNN
jgi:hypothetical protein